MELRMKKLKKLFLFPALAVMTGCFCYQSAVGIKTAAAETKHRALISAQTTSFDQNETLQNVIRAEEQGGGVSALSLNTDTNGFSASRDYGGVFLVDGILHINVVDNEHYESNARYFSQMFYGEQEVVICPVEHTLERLEQLNELLSDHWGELNIRKMALMEKENYVEVFLENPDDDEDITDFVAQNGYPLSAVKISQYKGISLEATTIYGGDLITVNGYLRDASNHGALVYSTVAGSIGACAVNSSGQLGIVTAAHVVLMANWGNNHPQVFYSYNQTTGHYIGTLYSQYMKFYTDNLDATFVPFETEAAWNVTYECHYKTSTAESYCTIDDKVTATENTSKLIVGATVVKYGTISNVNGNVITFTPNATTGVITSTNATSNTDDPVFLKEEGSSSDGIYLLENLIEADYYSENGDSGGSVFIETYNGAARTYTNYLVGIHNASDSDDNYVSYATKISAVESILNITIITKKNYSQYV